jgi:hypothetical protein
MRKLDYHLQAELSMGVAELYRLALNSYKEFGTVDNTNLVYLNNRIYYYIAYGYDSMRQVKTEEFKQTGQFYGHQITYLKLAVSYLEGGEKDLVYNFNSRIKYQIL